MAKDQEILNNVNMLFSMNLNYMCVYVNINSSGTDME